jgi:hypothetical protein
LWVAFILIQYQCPRQETFCTLLSRACPNLQLNGTDTADHPKACFLSAGAFPVDAGIECWLCPKLMELTVPFFSPALGQRVQLEQWGSNQGDFSPRGSLAMSGDILNCHYVQEQLLLASIE